MTKTIYLLGAALLLSTVGCGGLPGFITKKHQEAYDPTDVRQVHRWLWGEDAILATPLGPDEAYHGHKPTCWRPWQAPATVWRDEHCCGPPAIAPTSGIVTHAVVTAAPPETSEPPNTAGPEPLGLPPENGVESLPPAPLETLEPIEPPAPAPALPLPELSTPLPPGASAKPLKSKPTGPIVASRLKPTRSDSLGSKPNQSPGTSETLSYPSAIQAAANHISLERSANKRSVINASGKAPRPSAGLKTTKFSPGKSTPAVRRPAPKPVGKRLPEVTALPSPVGVVGAAWEKEQAPPAPLRQPPAVIQSWFTR